MLYGSYNHALDEKGRLVIPAKFVRSLSNKLFLVKGYEGTMCIYPSDAFDSYLAKLAKLPDSQKLSRDVLRIALSSVVELELDSKNRIQFSPSVLAKYNISSKVYVVGMLDHLEVWDESKWLNYAASNEPLFEEKSEELLGKKDG